MKNCVLGAEQFLVEKEMFSFLFVVAVGLPHDRLLIHTRFVLIWNFAGISFRRMWLLLPILSHPQILS